MTETLAQGRVRLSRGRLADGREILYFDDSGTPGAAGAAARGGHRAVDRRPLPPAPEHPGQLRLDVLTGEWVVIAGHRNDRTFLPPSDRCPLCPTRPGGAATEIPTPDYDVVVFENRFPSLSERAAAATGPVDGDPLWPTAPATGRCEVVCFTSDHTGSAATLSPQRARTVIEAWAQRTAELSARPGVAQVACFENRGEEIGVTLEHPHGQLYAYPFLPPRTADLLRRAAEHRAGTGGALLADVLAAERRAGSRVVHSGRHWTAYVPAAARWPVEVHLAPHRDVPDLAALDAGEREELAELYPQLLRRLDRYFPGVSRLPYIAAWHQAPVGEGRELGRLYLQVFSLLRAPGKLKYLAGSESAYGAWVNDAVPERIAARLRETGEEVGA